MLRTMRSIFRRIGAISDQEANEILATLVKDKFLRIEADGNLTYLD